mgnify:CR=1 FL=1
MYKEGSLVPICTNHQTLFDAYHDGEISAEDRRGIYREIYNLTRIKARDVISVKRLRGAV